MQAWNRRRAIEIVAVIGIATYWGGLSGYVARDLIIGTIRVVDWQVSAIPWVTAFILTAFVAGTFAIWRCPACKKSVTWRWDIRACQQCGVVLRSH